jgi:hypothetical protein
MQENGAKKRPEMLFLIALRAPQEPRRCRGERAFWKIPCRRVELRLRIVISWWPETLHETSNNGVNERMPVQVRLKERCRARNMDRGDDTEQGREMPV